MATRRVQGESYWLPPPSTNLLDARGLVSDDLYLSHVDPDSPLWVRVCDGNPCLSQKKIEQHAAAAVARAERSAAATQGAQVGCG